MCDYVAVSFVTAARYCGSRVASLALLSAIRWQRSVAGEGQLLTSWKAMLANTLAHPVEKIPAKISMWAGREHQTTYG